MGVAATRFPDAQWLQRYKVQDRKTCRAISVPPEVALDQDDLVWIWEHQPMEEDRMGYLKVSQQPPRETQTESAEELCSQQGYTVRKNGRGNLLTIPNRCDEEHFSPGSHVVVLRSESDGNKPPHLKIVPSL